MTKNDITVLLVDDHALVRRGFRRILEDEAGIHVVGEAANGLEAIDMAQRFRPKVIVMDMSMPELDGVQATIEILKKVPETGILILSMYGEEGYVRNAFEAGARGYILKNAIELDLTVAVREVSEGKQHLGPGVQLPSKSAIDDSYERLTNREKQVLQLIAQGHSNKEIAALLGLSVNTVSVHRANLMEALNIHRTAELVRYAMNKGLVTPR
ncbi:MAG: response regulator transcription factor [Bryobacteraceae bacterium]|nr:response regulator transcription factor [Bryobacteraceae bacterium]